MKTIKITIKPESYFKYFIESDTFAGEFIIGIKYIYGEKSDIFNQIINNFKKGSRNKPPIIFSNGFPENKIPVPFIPVENDIIEICFEEIEKKGVFKKIKYCLEKETGQILTVEEIVYYLKKQIKKIKFMDINFLKNMTGNINQDLFVLKKDLYYKSLIEKKISDLIFRFENRDKNESEKKYLNFQYLPHASIDRMSNTVRSGGFYFTKYLYFNTNIDIYIKYDPAFFCYNSDEENKVDIYKVISFIGEKGYGGKSSIGAGSFKIVEKKENPLNFDSYAQDRFIDKKDQNIYFLSLSNIVYDDDFILSESFYDIKVKYGKVYDIFYTESKNPFKNPFVHFIPGSLFKVKKVKNYYGRNLLNTFTHGKPVVQVLNGMGLFLKFQK